MTIARRAVYDYASQVGVLATSLVAGILFSRAYGTQGTGVLYAAMFALTFATVFTNFGVRAANQYLIGKDPACAAMAHTLTILFTLLSTAIAFGAAYLLRGAAMKHLLARFNVADLRMLWFAALAVPLSLYNFGWEGILIGLGRVRTLAVFNLLFQGAQGAAIIAVVALGGPIWAVLAAWIAVWIAGTAAMAALLRDCPPRIAFDGTLFRSTLSYGLRAFAGNFAGNLMQHFNKAAIAACGGPDALGVYGKADQYSTKFFFHNQALERAGFQSVAATDEADAARLACRLVRASLYLGLGVCVLGGAAGSVLLWLNGPGFVSGIPLLWLMLAGPLAQGGSRMLAMFYSGQRGKPQIPSALAWAGAGLNILLVSAGARAAGLPGAAIGTSMSYILHFLLYVALFRRAMRRYGLPWRALFALGADDRRWIREKIQGLRGFAPR